MTLLILPSHHLTPGGSRYDSNMKPVKIWCYSRLPMRSNIFENVSASGYHLWKEIELLTLLALDWLQSVEFLVWIFIACLRFYDEIDLFRKCQNLEAFTILKVCGGITSIHSFFFQIIILILWKQLYWIPVNNIQCQSSL